MIKGKKGMTVLGSMIIVLLVILIGIGLVILMEWDIGLSVIPQPSSDPLDTTQPICKELPDFSGTPREGKQCFDNLDCINFPPENYEGGSLNCVRGLCQFNC